MLPVSLSIVSGYFGEEGARLGSTRTQVKKLHNVINRTKPSPVVVHP